MDDLFVVDDLLNERFLERLGEFIQCDWELKFEVGNNCGWSITLTVNDRQRDNDSADLSTVFYAVGGIDEAANKILRAVQDHYAGAIVS